MKRKKRKEMTENEISNKVIGAAIEIHKSIGTGALCTAINLSETIRSKAGPINTL